MLENKFQQWFNLFEKAWKIRVIENEHLMYPCFLEFLASINKSVRYVYAAKYKYLHLCCLKIQQSGTGKGVGDDLVGECLSRLGFKTIKLNNFTEAGMIGSMKESKNGEPIPVYGELRDKDFIWIDEARCLLEGNKWSQELLSVMNGYLDDGRIYKRLAKGAIDYSSNCCIGTGTFYFDLLKQKILDTGFFQRSLISYKNYSTDDVLRISEKYDFLNENDFERDFKPIIEEMKILYKSIDWKKYLLNIENGKYVIKINSKANREIGKRIDLYFKENLADCFGNASLNNIMNSCLIRSKEMAHKVMCLYAIFNDDAEAGENSVDFSFEIVKNHLDSIKNLISEIFEEDKFSDFNTESKKERKRRNARNALISLIKNNPGISSGNIRDYIQNNRIQFYLGELAVLKLIPELEKEGVIEIKTLEDNKTKTHYIINNTDNK
jgi:hypothetical protein